MADGVARVRDYYQARGESEWHRLAAPFDGGVEWEVHSRAFQQWLEPGSRVLDLGGGPGRWAIWLAERGHRVVLGDLSPVQLDIARREIAAAGAPVEEVVELDARDLSRFPDGSFDAALALGPFYHLVAASDRARALSEVHRVLRPGGRLLATVMCRYVWLLGVLLESGSAALEEVRRGLADGVYHPTAPGRFTEAFLFRPAEVSPFFESGGFRERGLLASQSLLALVQEQAAELRERDEAAWAALMELAYEVAADPSIQGLAAHLLFIGDRG